jgi:hypothetical protein
MMSTISLAARMRSRVSGEIIPDMAVLFPGRAD